jgi:multiple sugar transport system ATP-binding protein
VTLIEKGNALPYIELSKLTKRFPDGSEAVRELDLRIGDGEFMILVGPSGCGKSTTLRMVAGLEEITSGEIRISGEIVNDKAPSARDIAMVFQSYALYPHMTVRDNMGFALRMAKRSRREIEQKVAEAAHILDLTAYLERKPKQLSGGQRQRVAMGRAIVRDPKAFLMDEPLSNLDAKLRVQMRAEIARIQKRLGVTTVYVTHDQTEAMTLGDRVAVMRSGSLQQVDTPKGLYARPANVFVAEFIGAPAMNLLRARIDNQRFVLPFGEVPLTPRLRQLLGAAQAGSEVIVGVRPQDFEDARLAGSREHGLVFEADIELSESMGSETYVYCTVADGVVVSFSSDEPSGHETNPSAERSRAVVARVSAESTIGAGERALLWLNTEKLHLFDPLTGENLDRATSGSR